MDHSFYALFETALGWCGIAWREPTPATAVCAVLAFQLPEATRALTAARIARRSRARESNAPPPIVALIGRIRSHLQGTAQDFRDVPLELGGLETFARQVYEATRAIPAGETRTYSEIARAILQPAAARAVGRALGRNPIGLIIPCHRVVAADGSPGGFSAHGGRSTKSQMLEIESRSRQGRLSLG